MRVVGLMSGTSFDGIDAAVADLDARRRRADAAPARRARRAVRRDLRAAIEAALPPRATTLADGVPPRHPHRPGVRRARGATRSSATAGDLIVSPRPDASSTGSRTARVEGTLQLGQPAWIAERDRRCRSSRTCAPRDVAAGGQGAPLVSAARPLLLQRPPGPPAALNLGGIANLTVPARSPSTSAPPTRCSTPPRGTSRAARYDEDGRLAARGTVDRALLERLLADPYYARPAPKTTGKEHFHPAYRRALGPARRGRPRHAHRAHRAHRRRRGARHGVTEVIASGGGVRNPTLMAALREELAPSRPATRSACPRRPRRPTRSPCSASSPTTASPARSRARPAPATPSVLGLHHTRDPVPDRPRG